MRWLMFALGLVVAGQAHDAMSSGALVQVTAKRVDVIVDLGEEAAWLLLGESADIAPDLDRAMDRLKAQVTKVYQLSLRGKPLSPSETSVERRDDGGVAFKFVYARPAAGGSLRCEALFLKKMAEGHLTTLTIIDAGDNVIAAEILGTRQTAAEFPWPLPGENEPVKK